MNQEKLMKEMRKLMQMAQKEQDEMNKMLFTGKLDNNLAICEFNGDFSSIKLNIDLKQLSNLDPLKLKTNIESNVLNSYNEAIKHMGEYLGAREKSMEGFNTTLQKLTKGLNKNLQQKLENFEQQSNEAFFVGKSSNDYITIMLDQDNKMLTINIKEEIIDIDEKELLEDLIIQAMKDAIKQKQKTLENSVKM